MKIKELPTEEKPRERLVKYGVEHLNNNELVSILLGTGIKNKSVIDLSNEVLNILNKKSITLNSLLQINGLGLAKASIIISSLELSKRVLYKTNINPLLNNSDKIYNFLHHIYKNEEQESFVVLCLNTKKRLISYKKIFIGTLSEVTIHPREILKYAINECADTIVIAHNHPSEDTNPSNNDISITKTINDSCKLIGIPLVDHIIYGNNSYYSFFGNGEL